MHSNLKAKDIMATTPLVLNDDMPICNAIDLFSEKRISGAPVINLKGALVGFLSIHDVMVELWCQDYIPDENQKVCDLMKQNVIAIDVNEPLIDIVEFLCLDKTLLYPISTVGIGTQSKMTSFSVEERAKTINISKPQIVPVVNNGMFIGVIYRVDVIKALRLLYRKNQAFSKQYDELRTA